VLEDTRTFTEPAFETYTVEKTVTVCVDPECGDGSDGMGAGGEACDPFPTDGLITYTYSLTNADTSNNDVIGWVIDTGVPGAIVEAGFLPRGDGSAPSKIIVSEDASRVEWGFFSDPIGPGESSEPLYIISSLIPAEVDGTVLGDFALDTAVNCIGPAEVGTVCLTTIWQGAGTNCEDDACPQPTGACCFEDGFCTTVTEERCAADGGEYQGDFTQGNCTNCKDVACPQPTGACCFPNGQCTFKTEEACINQGGMWQGAGITCDPSPCPPPTGACCYDDGSCADQLTIVDCIGGGGIYQGDFTTCDDVACPQPI
jgi:hypothetical protein